MRARGCAGPFDTSPYTSAFHKNKKEHRRQTEPVRHLGDGQTCRYHYCKSCGHLADVVSGGRLALPTTLCTACAQLKIWGWLPNRQR